MKSVILLLFAFLTSTGLAKDESLGSWRDRVGPTFERVIEIVRTEKGLVQRSTFTNGEVVNRPLTEKTPQEKDRTVFLVTGNARGDGCAITKNGDLEIFDSEGVIRIARKISGP